MPAFARRTIDRLLRTAPALESISHDRQAAMVAIVHATMISSVLDLEPGAAHDPDALRAYCERVMGLVSDLGLDEFRGAPKAPLDSSMGSPAASRRPRSSPGSGRSSTARSWASHPSTALGAGSTCRRCRCSSSSTRRSPSRPASTPG